MRNLQRNLPQSLVLFLSIYRDYFYVTIANAFEQFSDKMFQHSYEKRFIVGYKK